jgi:hypothetical protein
VKDRLLSFTLRTGFGLFLVVSLIVNARIFAAGKFLNSGTAPPEALVQITRLGGYFRGRFAPSILRRGKQRCWTLYTHSDEANSEAAV